MSNEALLLAVAGFCSGLALPGMIALLLVQVWTLRTMAWRWVSTPLDVPLGVLALAVIASAIASPWRDDAAARAAFFVLAVAVSIPAVAAYVKFGADRVRMLLLVWIGGGTAAALLGVIQAWSSGFTVKPTAADFEPNRLGATLASALVLALGLIVGGTLKARWLMVATAILFAGLLATMSRSAWVAAVAGLVILTALGTGGRRRLALALACGMVAMVCVFLVARPFASAVWKPGAKSPSMRQALGEMRSVLSMKQNQNRLVLWRTALRIATDHPVLGTGFGTFGMAFAEYRPPDSLETHDPPFAHNVFLNFAAETGVPGLVAFALVYATGLTATWRWLTRSPPASSARAVALAVLAALVTMLTNEFFEGAAMTVHTGFGVLALLAIGAAGARYLAPARGGSMQEAREVSWKPGPVETWARRVWEGGTPHKVWSSVGRAGSSLLVALRWPLWVCIPTDRTSDTLKILFLSTTFTTFALYTMGFSFGGGVYQFLDWAVAIASGGHLPATVGYGQRDIGFPLLLWLGGYPQTHSLLGITTIHAVMAALMPVLTYLALRPFSAIAAFFVAIMSLCSFFPLINMKMIHPDQAYAFFILLSAWLLIAYVRSRQPVYLGLGTLSVIVVSVTRPAGNLPFLGNLVLLTFIVLAFVFVRAPWRRYALPVVIGLPLLLGYSYYRHVLFQVPFGREMPTHVGKQVFYNVYLNAKEFGAIVSPELGPSMRELAERTYRGLLPDPRRSPLLKTYGPGDAAFNQRYFYPYTAKELLSQLYALPNWEYYLVLSEIVQSEDLLLSASWEVVRRYPLYPLKYTMRNMWHLLAAPGWKHSRYNADPFAAEGNYFPLDLHSYTQVDRLPPEAPAIKELQFYELGTLPGVVQGIYQAFKAHWDIIFDWSLSLSLYLIVLAFVAVCLKYFTNVLRLPRLSALKTTLNDVLPCAAAPAFFAISILFLEELTMAGALGEPDLRSYYTMLGLRFVVAGFGMSVAFTLLRPLLQHVEPAKRLARAVREVLPRPSARTKLLFATALAFYAMAGIAGWVLHIVRQVW